MSYSIDFDGLNRRATVVWNGSVGIEDSLNCLAELIEFAGSQPGIDVLHDLRDASWDITVAEAAGLSNKVTEAGSGLGTGRVAYVASDDVTFGISRMYGLMTDKSLRDMATFRDLASAKDWLGWDEQ